MDQRDIEIADSDATDEANLSTNPNKTNNLVDTKIQTCDECSQDLFDDDESSGVNSPRTNFDLSEIARVDSPCIADLTDLTQTPKIGIRNSSPYHPTVPTIPKSLVPFISTINESWNSELETPQAKTAAELNLQWIEGGDQLSKSCETMDRQGCELIKSNGVIPDVTTPSGCFVTQVENTDISTSPILSIRTKRKCPKRRILKSLIDTTISTDNSNENTMGFSADSHQVCGADSFVGFKTASGKTLIISKTAMTKSRAMYESSDILKSELPEDNSTKEFINPVDIGKNKSSIRNCYETHETDIESTLPSSSGAASSRNMEIEESIVTETKKTLKDEDFCNLQRVPSSAYEKMNIISDFEQSEQQASENLSEVTQLDDLINEPQQTNNQRYLTSECSLRKRHSVDNTMSTGISNPRLSFSIGFSTASGKAIQISNEALLNAKNLLDEKENSCKSSLSICKTATRDTLAGFSTGNGKPIKISDRALSNAKNVLAGEEINYKSSPINRIVDNRGAVGFSTANGKPIKMSETALVKAKRLFATELENTSPIDHIVDNRSAVGFSTANGKPMKMSETALVKAKRLFATELENTSPIDRIVDNRSAVGFSTANGKPIKMSETALVKAKKLFATELENTPPLNASLKRNRAAMETPVTNCISESKTPALKSVSENIISHDTPVGVSCLHTSKKIRFSSDLQARKLFGETGEGTDEETEYPEKFYRENDSNPRALLTSSNNCAHHLLNHDRNKNVSLNQNSTAGLYAKSEMFEINDRPVMPKLKAQKSWPLNKDTDTKQFAEKFKNDDTKSGQVQIDRKISIYSDEISASINALLADEKNSLDEKSWASAITCSPPTLIEDRQVSMEPITLGTSCSDVLEAPMSPIIGAKSRLRRKIKQNSRNVLKKDTSLKTTKDNGCDINERLEEQVVTQDSQQSSSVATPTSDSSKESNRNMSTVIENALVSKLEILEEISRSVECFDNQSESLLEQNISDELDDREALDYLLQNRIAATLKQEKLIRAKKKCKPKPIPGNLFLRKSVNREPRVSWHQATNGVPPTPRTFHELMNLRILPNVMDVTAATALDYRFKCFDFYSKEEIRANADGLEIGDGGWLIFDENGYAGVAEFEQAFMASPGVDPTLVPQRWVENHYRWIVWKLASMDRMKFGDLLMPRMLTPHHVMQQLKYRYDREIDKSQRSALRRIMEKDAPPCRRMVLCVATITKIENIEALEMSPKMNPTSHWKVELTDGWYSITATIDSAMAHLIAFGKVREGTKLITCGAELLNCDQGFSPLEIPGDVSLKIHTNSTRRTRWDTKLGYCKHAVPIRTSLSAILPNGGLIGKLDTIIARVYPIQYFEKTPSGQSIFRNIKCEDKAAMIYEQQRLAQIDTIYAQARATFEARYREHSKASSAHRSKSYEYSSQETGNGLSRDEWNDGDSNSQHKNCRDMSEETIRNKVEALLRDNLPPPRNVTLVLKVRVMEGVDLAILTVWAPSEDIVDVLKEGNRVFIHNIQTSGKRSGEFQLTAGRQSFVKLEESNVGSFPQRCLTSIPEVAVVGFSPPFGEFDTVGMVVSFGPAPHGMKDFEVVNLAYPNPDSSNSAYLSILFWEGIGAHGFADILSVGATVACTNLQWRRGAPRTIPMAYSTEHSTFTQNPRPTYLRSAFDSVKDQITDPIPYASQCAAEIAIEHHKKSTILRSPAVQGTPSKASLSAGSVQEKFTPGSSPQTPQCLANPGGNTPAKYSVQRRLEKLQWYMEPPDLSPVALNHSSTKVNQRFVPPVRTPDNLERAGLRRELNLKK